MILVVDNAKVNIALRAFSIHVAFIIEFLYFRKQYNSVQKKKQYNNAIFYFIFIGENSISIFFL